MKAYKVKLVTEDQSRRVQEHAFNLGYTWHFSNKSVSHLNKNYLYFEDDGNILFDDGDDLFFKRLSNEEISITDFLNLTFNDVCVKMKDAPKPKVYCKDCTYCTRHDRKCTYAYNTKLVHTAYEEKVEYYPIEKFNSNNDCKNFDLGTEEKTK